MQRRSSKERDFAVIARRVVEQAVGEHLDGTPLEPSQGPVKNINAVALGRLGRQKGDIARAKKLSAAERKNRSKSCKSEVV